MEEGVVIAVVPSQVPKYRYQNSAAYGGCKKCGTPCNNRLGICKECKKFTCTLCGQPSSWHTVEKTICSKCDNTRGAKIKVYDSLHGEVLR